MDLILHIGSEKTGTTTVQHALTASSDGLFAHTGILYPTRSVLFGGHAHFPVLSFLLPPEQLDFVADEQRLTRATFVAELARLARAERPGALLLSAEHLSSRLGLAEVAALADAVAASRCVRSVRVLYYARPQHELVVSYFSESLKYGAQSWITERPHAVTNLNLNHQLRLGFWRECFPPGAITVRPYSAGSDTVADFCAALGIPAGLVGAADPRRNESVSLEVAHCLHALNLTWPQDRHMPEERAAWMRRFDLRMRIARMLHARWPELTRTSLAASLTHDQLLAIHRRFLPSNEKLSAGHALGPAFLAPPPEPPPPPAIDRAMLLARAVVALDGL